MEMKRLNDIFPEWITSGIFSKLSNYSVPWKDSTNSASLDVAYHGSHSGDKYISPFIEKMLTDGVLSDENLNKIISTIYAIYCTNWTKLWDTLSFEYNPIENYAMTETESGTESGEYKQTGTDTINTSSNVQNSNDNNNSVFGFNSSDAVGSDKQSGSNTNTSTGESTNTKNLINNDIKTNERTLKRSGNIGVTTSQQMIESERDLWKWYYFDMVFNDIDKMLTLQIY